MTRARMLDLLEKSAQEIAREAQRATGVPPKEQKQQMKDLKRHGDTAARLRGHSQLRKQHKLGPEEGPALARKKQEPKVRVRPKRRTVNPEILGGVQQLTHRKSGPGISRHDLPKIQKSILRSMKKRQARRLRRIQK